ncbi:MAG: alpha-isopropylmalate synthase regulatory domain-containing protein, partial [Clostridia bacterium]|nr:alpha-isopropylmalate synthase regulatory domain-containing protein [Clostridia bacterium]
ESSSKKAAGVYENTSGDSIMLDSKDSIESVCAAVNMLGYDLSEEDSTKVYEEFCRVAQKKKIGAKELDAIVASVALQVPPTYKLVSYVINSGNIMPASAQIKLSRTGEELQGITVGDGPIDAAFRTIEQIIGHHYELDDFQIQSVTEGKEAMGSAVVKLRSNGKLYSGKGISTDIIAASIRAYISALNKIVFEEA